MYARSASPAFHRIAPASAPRLTAIPCLLACILAVAFTGFLTLPGFAQGVTPGTLSDVTFTEYSSLSGNAELARRMLTPLTAARLPVLLARSGMKLREQPVNLSVETLIGGLAAPRSTDLALELAKP